MMKGVAGWGSRLGEDNMTNAFGCFTLAVVGMPSTPLALCSANFFARFAFSSDNLSGMLALEINTERSRILEQQKQNELSSLKNNHTRFCK